MNTVSKALLGTAAAGAMAVTSAAPASARDRYDNDGISAGEVIAGAVILGGIAAVASSIGKDRDRYRGDYRYDRGYRDNYYRSRGNPRAAVERCVAAATQEARRYGYRGVRVTDIRDVDDTRYGWRVKGRIAVEEDSYRGRYGYRDRNYRYNSRYDRNRYGYGRSGYGDKDHGRFTCDIQRGRVVDIDYSGISGPL
ncbi:hypothetical protein PF049_10795 [Erythrobacteraceae bacterium WH01K]|nr:hypothetical protein PF049_10795 [Erythrobacteraceae bacterium WH01K]